MSKVCVTGASSYIGGHVIRILLERGYTVVGTARDPSSESSVGHLHALPGASERLTLLPAVLESKDGFLAAFAGCTGVIHTASPIGIQGGEDDFVKPAVSGNENVLNAAKEVGTVKRVVITSSMSAVCGAPGSKPDDYVFSDEDWSDPENQRSREVWYSLSKTLAEKKAWELHKSLPIEVVTICPTFVVGPAVQSSPPSTVNVILKTLKGETEIKNSSMSIVDVRDVALAHVNALEKDVDGQRFILVAEGSTWPRIAQHLRDSAPEAKIQSTPAFDKEAVPSHFKLDKTRDLLGGDFIPTAQTFKDMVEYLRGKF